MMGRERIKIVSFPPRMTLSATAELPKSLRSPALNSVRYPTPTIFRRILIRPFSIPVSLAIVDRILTVFWSMSTTNIKIMMMPVIVTAKESSGLVLLRSIAEIAVTKAMPIILKISVSVCPYHPFVFLHFSFSAPKGYVKSKSSMICPNKSPIMPTTIVRTRISPTMLTTVAISSRSDFLRI